MYSIVFKPIEDISGRKGNTAEYAVYEIPEFITFYFPDAYAEIDWSKEHVFLDQELRAVVQDAERMRVGSWQWAVAREENVET